MNPLYILYLAVGVIAALFTIWGTWHQIKKKVDKAVEPVANATPHLIEVASKLDETLQRGSRLTQDVETYEAVTAANNALRKVIADSTNQLAQAAVQVAASTDELRKVRVELAAAVADKAKLQERVTNLEAEVRDLRTRLEYFTTPPFGGTMQH